MAARFKSTLGSWRDRRRTSGGADSDVGISACPPGVEPESFSSTAHYLAQCNVDEYFAFDKVSKIMPQLEATAVGVTNVVAVLDPSSAIVGAAAANDSGGDTWPRAILPGW